MGSINEIDMFERDEFSGDIGGGYTFDKFKAEYPGYLDSLNNYIKLIYSTYMLVHHKRFLKIKKTPDHYEIACKCGFGMLMRHAMETIVTSIATEMGIEVGGRSVFERLSALDGQQIALYDSNKKKVLYKLLDLTNSIAHPHIIGKESANYQQLKSFYESSFSYVLNSHIEYLENTIKNSRKTEFGITREISRNRKQSLKYLRTIKSQLDNINIFNKTTSILVQGCLVRQLTECTANLWAYNYEIVPTDVSTFENQISLSSVLTALLQACRSNRKNAFGVSALTGEVMDNLFDLKSASNSLMHVDKFASGNLSEQGEELSKLYNIVKEECSPNVMNKKLNDAQSLNRKPKKKQRVIHPEITALLCGTLGWLGAHHFYVGNIVKGVTYIPFLGLIVGPTRDLYRIFKGRFRNARGIRMPKTTLSSIIAFILLLAHLGLWYIVGSSLYKGKGLKDIGNFLELEACESEEIENMKRLKPEYHTATSTLTTEQDIHYAENCSDNDPSTSWQEDVLGNGEDESITFRFNEYKTISAIVIYNGNHKNKNSYYNNARANEIILQVGIIPFKVTLEDTMEKQIFRLPFNVKADMVKITVKSATAGEKYEDLCISEVEILTEKPNEEPQRENPILRLEREVQESTSKE